MAARSALLPAFLPALLLALGCGPGAAFAQDEATALVHELKLGLLDHDTGNLWSGFNREEGVDINFEAIFTPSVDLVIATLRPAVGASFNTEGDTSKIYVDARLERDFESGIFLAAGIGAAVHDGKLNDGHRDRKALGSRVLFHIPVEIGYRFDEHHGLSVYFDHVSNAFLADENDGMDTLGMRYGYRF
jgi:lipid A 3-O-deacylase